MNRVLILSILSILVSVQDTVHGISVEIAGNEETVPESYTASPATPNTTFTLNITVIFGKLENNQSYDFNGHLIIPLSKILEETLRLNISKVHFKDGTTLFRTAHLGKVTLEGIWPKLDVSFEPEIVDSSTRKIFIKKILLNEAIQTIRIDGKKTQVTTSTINRFFGDGQDFGLDGTVTYPNSTQISQYMEDFGTSTQTFGSASAAHVSVTLIALSLAALFLN